MTQDILSMQILARGLESSFVARDILTGNLRAIFPNSLTYQMLARVITNHYNQTSDLLTNEAFRYNSQKEYAKQENMQTLGLVDKTEYYDTVNQLLNTKIDESNELILAMNKYLKNNLTTDLVLKNAERIQREPDFDMSKALALGLDKINQLDINGSGGDTIAVLGDSGQKKLEEYSKLKLDKLKMGIHGFDLATSGGLAKGEVAMIGASSGFGKAQPVDTLIPTPEGMVLLGDLKVGDYVFTRQGRPTKVLGVYDKGVLPNFKVTTIDNQVTYANEEHLFSYWSSLGQQGAMQTKTLKQISQTPLYHLNEKGRYRYNYFIPILSEPIKYAHKGYLKHCYELGNIFMEHATYNVLGIDRFDYIPKKYKESSIKNRFEIVQGFFDRGASINTKYDLKVCLRLDSESLVKSMVGIIRSLGYRTKYYRESLKKLSDDNKQSKVYRKYLRSYARRGYKSVKRHMYYGKYVRNSSFVEEHNRKYSYVIQVMGSKDNLKKLFKNNQEKQIKIENSKSYNYGYDRTAIKSITPLKRPESMRCIYVEDEEHLYVTNDYIATHNTSILTNIDVAYAKQGLNVFHLSLEELTPRMLLRFDRIMTDKKANYFVSGGGSAIHTEQVLNAQKAYHTLQDHGKLGEIIFRKERPQRITVDQVKQMVISYERAHNITFDIVTLDYPDLLKNDKETGDISFDGGRLYQKLADLSQELNVVLWTATQLNRMSSSQDIRNLDSIQGSYQKRDILSFACTLNRTNEEYQKGYIRLFLDKIRNKEDFKGDMLYFKYHMDSGRITDETQMEKEEHASILGIDTNSIENGGYQKTNQQRQKINKRQQQATDFNKIFGAGETTNE